MVRHGRKRKNVVWIWDLGTKVCAYLWVRATRWGRGQVAEEGTGQSSNYHTWGVVQSVSGMHAGDPNTSVMPGWQWLHSTPVRLRAHGEMLSQGQGLSGDGLPSQQ